MLLLPPAFPPWHPQNSGVHDAALYLTQRAGVAGEESGVAEGIRRHFVAIQAVSWGGNRARRLSLEVSQLREGG